MNTLNSFNLKANNYTPTVYASTQKSSNAEFFVAIINEEDGLAFRLSTVTFASELVTPIDNDSYWTDPREEALKWVKQVKNKGMVDLSIWEPILDYQKH